MRQIAPSPWRKLSPSLSLAVPEVARMSKVVLFIWMLTFLSGGSCIAGPDQPGPNGILIRVYHKHRISAADLSRAEEVASGIFTNAGVTVSWGEGSPEDIDATSLDFSASAGNAASCAARRDFSEIRLDLLR